MVIPGRSFSAGNQYRYGFNGQEKSIEIGEGLTTAEFWEYDSRIARRWNADPVSRAYEAPYATFGNNPIFHVDWMGNSDTTVISAGGANAATLDNGKNSLEFYQSSNYFLTGTKTSVPVQAGQLRSFSNELGTFSATWKAGENGGIAFLGYQNSKGQTLDAAVAAAKDNAESVEFWATFLHDINLGKRLIEFSESGRKSYEDDPVNYATSLALMHITIYGLAAAEPQGYSPTFNPSVTTQESMSALGTLEFESLEAVTVFNSKGIPYPNVHVDGYGAVPFPNGPYSPNNSQTLRSSFTPKLKNDFKDWWIAQGRNWPTAPEGSFINIHHMKPLSKGGTNAFNNLIPLIQPEEHQPFTNWWRGFQ